MVTQAEETNGWVLTPDRHYIVLENGGTVEIHHMVNDVTGDLVFRACYQESEGMHMPLGQCKTRLEAVAVANDSINYWWP